MKSSCSKAVTVNWVPSAIVAIWPLNTVNGLALSFATVNRARPFNRISRLFSLNGSFQVTSLDGSNITSELSDKISRFASLEVFTSRRTTTPAGLFFSTEAVTGTVLLTFRFNQLYPTATINKTDAAIAVATNNLRTMLLPPATAPV
jgi:hypothetical protein